MSTSAGRTTIRLAFSMPTEMAADVEEQVREFVEDLYGSEVVIEKETGEDDPLGAEES